MGVPSFFRWLSRKYPKIISPVIEEENDLYTNTNPNGELDNLYLDMNGIVHPCSHPENKPPPENEDEMLLAVFEYTNRVLNMARPRKVLYIAVDGVAPRAKMNQQRARRFRSAKEAAEKDGGPMEDDENLDDDDNSTSESGKSKKKTWDSNAITPGTPFMDKLASGLRYWISFKLSTDPGWKDLQVIISDATVPGEGEHKIMSFIRAQRQDPQYNPNTTHCIYGLDADLIFLGLATHEPHFKILREDVFEQTIDKRSNRNNSRYDPKRELSEQEKQDLEAKDKKKPFLWLHISVLREYLRIELFVPRLSFPFDFERAIDDWVFMCFFCGNDFLPHLPSLDVRENSIDSLVRIWKEILPTFKEFMTLDGHLNYECVEKLLRQLGSNESRVFMTKRSKEMRKLENQHKRKLQQLENEFDTSTAVEIGESGGNHTNAYNKKFKFDQNGQTLAVDKKNDEEEEDSYDPSSSAQSTSTLEPTDSNMNKAEQMRSKLKQLKDKRTFKQTQVQDKFQEYLSENNLPSAPTPSSGIYDSDQIVKLYEPGYQERYYKIKFGCRNAEEIHKTKRNVVKSYFEGISWVLLYYYQGCQSWNWYYPFHYAPFAQDFVNLGELLDEQDDMTDDGVTDMDTKVKTTKREIAFELGEPFTPFEQLMSVLPASSGHTLPKIFRELMKSPDSEIIEFYPTEFPIDMNGKKMQWQGITILPFINEKKLLKAVRAQYVNLSDADKERNKLKKEILLMSKENVNYGKLKAQVYEHQAEVEIHHFNSGLSGIVKPNDEDSFDINGKSPCPVSGGFPDLENKNFMKFNFANVQHFENKSIILNGYIPHFPALTQVDRDNLIHGFGTSYNRRGGYGNQSYGQGHGMYFRVDDMKANIIKTGPYGNTQYKPRLGGYKSFYFSRGG